MKNAIISKILECEKASKLCWYTEFSNEFESDYNSFTDALLKLRQSNLECITDDKLKKQIKTSSPFFFWN